MPTNHDTHPTELLEPISELNHQPGPLIGDIALRSLRDTTESPSFYAQGSIYGADVIEEHANYVASALADEPTVAGTEASILASINTIREDMGQFALVSEVSSDVDGYFDGLATMPSILKQNKAIAETEKGCHLSWCAWLAEDATTEQILNFFQWHNAHHAARARDPETSRQFDSLKLEYLEDVNRIKGSGFLHSEVSVAKARLDSISISLEDLFMSYMYGGAGHTDLEGKHIQLVEHYDKLTAKHELNHAVLGKYGEYLSDTWLDEALTDHVANVMEYGQELIVNPADRIQPPTNNGYTPELTLLASVLAKGRVPIDIRYFTHYYSAVNESTRDFAKAQLDEQMRAAYDEPDILSKISACLKQAWSMSTYEDNKYDQIVNELTDNPGLVLTKYVV